jgi:hypothetical protein
MNKKFTTVIVTRMNKSAVVPLVVVAWMTSSTVIPLAGINISNVVTAWVNMMTVINARMTITDTTTTNQVGQALIIIVVAKMYGKTICCSLEVLARVSDVSKMLPWTCHPLISLTRSLSS